MSDPVVSTPPPLPSVRMHAAVFAMSALVIWLMVINDDWGDEYTHLLLAKRITAGQVPYRDFFMHVLPAPGYIIAVWYKLFGDSMEGLRILMALCGAAATTIAFDICTLLIASPLLWIGTVGVLTTFIVGNEGLSHVVFSVPLALMAMNFAVRADRSSNRWHWFASGLFVALAATSTQTVGAWLGISLLVTTLSGAATFRQRLIHAAMLSAGTAVIMLPLIIALVAVGAWNGFIADIAVWAFQRYAPFHAGVGWGAWLPGWQMLSEVPHSWWPVWIPVLSITWAAVWILPLVPLVSLALAHFKTRCEGRRVLAFACAAMFLSSFPHAGAMRVVRLCGPVWMLVGLELHCVLFSVHRQRITALLAAGLSLFLLAASGLQWSYRHTLVELETPKGRALVKGDTRGEYEMLTRHYKPGTAVLAWPDPRGAEYLFALSNPVDNDYPLVPALFSPEQLQDIFDQLKRQDYPPIVILPYTIHPHANLQWIKDTFKPSKYLDEFQQDALNKFFREHYSLDFRDGPAIGLKRQPVH